MHAQIVDALQRARTELALEAGSELAAGGAGIVVPAGEREDEGREKGVGAAYVADADAARGGP